MAEKSLNQPSAKVVESSQGPCADLRVTSLRQAGCARIDRPTDPSLIRSYGRGPRRATHRKLQMIEPEMEWHIDAAQDHGIGIVEAAASNGIGIVRDGEDEDGGPRPLRLAV